MSGFIENTSERIFLAKKKLRSENLYSAIFFLVIGIVFTLFFSSPSAGMHGNFWVKVAFLAFIGSGFVLLAGLLFREYLAMWVERVTLREDSVVLENVKRTEEFSLSDVAELRWFKRGQNTVTLIVHSETYKVYLSSFDEEDRLFLIRFFRTRLPEEKQSRWAQYCYRNALPLRDALNEDEIREPDPEKGEFLNTRRRVDWYFGIGTVISTMIAIVITVLMQEPRAFILPVVFAVVGILVRFSMPKQGIVEEKISAAPGQLGYAIFVMISFVGFFGYVFVVGFFDLNNPFSTMEFYLLLFVWCLIGLRLAYKFNTGLIRHFNERAEESLTVWDEGEAKLVDGE